MNIQEFVTNMDLYIKVQFLKEYEQFLDNHYKENGIIKTYTEEFMNVTGETDKLKYVFWMNILYNEICREFAWKYIENQSSL